MCIYEIYVYVIDIHIDIYEDWTDWSNNTVKYLLNKNMNKVNVLVCFIFYISVYKKH